jgi:hypothetical protein
MGYKLNTEAFELLTQIEIGIREFLISIIKEKGIKEWFSNFLGSIQRETLTEVSKRVNEANKNFDTPQIEDQFIYKLNRAIKTIDQAFYIKNLCHPFYYLNWSDMENLMRNKSNIILFDQTIGKLNREALVDNLKNLNFLRNDIAHSRFISENDFQIIEGIFNQINGLIPNFKSFCENQTSEEKIDVVLKKISSYVDLIEKKELLSNKELKEILKFLEYCENSFWLNTIENSLLEFITNLRIELNDYSKFRNMPGGILSIHKIKIRNIDLFNKIKKITSNGKI